LNVSAGALPTAGQPTNVLGEPLQLCSLSPLTGFMRDGFCRTDANDRGLHLICSKVTSEFLQYSRSRGNDLMTPAPHYGFPGLKPGDQWCLCVRRWQEALHAGVAPPVVLNSSHINALDVVTLSELQTNPTAPIVAATLPSSHTEF
jgi:uncharacterized protein (DUF2237 family)